MTIGLMVFIMVLLAAVQAFMPYLVKATEVFGIYVPEPHYRQEFLVRLKKNYSRLVLAGGLTSVLFYALAVNLLHIPEGQGVIWGVGLQLGIVAFSMALYFKNHLTVKKEKQQQGWVLGKKEKVIVDLQFRNDLEMVSGIAFLLPMLITVGLIALTLTLYSQLPDKIPVHWGADGQADRFSEKTIFSSISMPVILLIMQVLFYFMNQARKTSGSKISATQKAQSRKRELASRKYGSWLLFVTSISVTLLLGSLQLSLIYPELGGALWVMAMTIGFAILVLAGTALYTVKIAQFASSPAAGQSESGIIDADNDRHWKAGIFYVNKEDPSIMVEKRFGIGWTVNLGNPKSWVMVFLPLAAILLIAFLVK
ncbi:DUF1648 domain-containing protein [Planococcus ruber]|uniref:DUF1648 domain-containing protein n=1 Tax=Planococcus ruber TaxID=2027871 RepID=UPI001FEFC7DD|nr:DUF5808 domain-containing protein [Planococcus ruber]MCJ1907914.1 DUF5808 domain-containing protein [Planococcus ruber]